MALAFGLCSQIMSVTPALLCALGLRLLLTGALHEDGLADFFDGMGGGRDRKQTLAIMKDSHIGTFGVLGLIFYFFFTCNILSSIAENATRLTCVLLLTGDVWSKCCSALLVMQLPYVRKEEEAKARIIYAPMQWGWQALRTLTAMVPAAILWFWQNWIPHPLALAAPLLTELLLMLWMRRRLGGYTGDCCGATFLLCEASFYMVTALLCH